MVRCYDIATMLADEFSEKNKLTYKEDAERKKDFEVTCEFADQYNKTFECTEMTVDVTDSGDIVISFVAEEIEGYFTESERHDEFYELMRRAKRMKITSADDDHLRVSYTFDGFWVEK